MEIIAADADDPAFLESPKDLRIKTPVTKRFIDRERIVQTAAGFEAAIHRFGLPFHERETAFRVGAFPFVEKIGAVDLGMIVSAGVVHAERAGCAEKNGLRVARIKRSLEPRHIKHVVERAGIAVDRHAVVKHAVVAGVAKRVGGSATSVLDGKDELRVPGNGQRPRELRADATQTVGTEQAAVHER